MNILLKSILRPISNRHYTNKKTSAFLYAFGYIPAVLLCIFGAMAVDPLFWLALAILVICAFVDYVVFDAFLDKLSWKLIWSRFYADETHARTAEYDAMKAYDADPSKENYQALQKYLKK